MHAQDLEVHERIQRLSLLLLLSGQLGHWRSEVSVEPESVTRDEQAGEEYEIRPRPVARDPPTNARDPPADVLGERRVHRRFFVRVQGYVG